MKRLSIYTVILFGVILLMSSSRRIKSPARSVSLVVKGHVLEEDKAIEGAVVKLYQSNKVVQMLKPKRGNFQFILFGGKQYMVEIDKDGFVTERIQISTSSDQPRRNKYLYEFNVDLISAKELDGVDISELDFPTALVKYDPKKDQYKHDMAYTRKVKDDLKKLQASAKKVNGK